MGLATTAAVPPRCSGNRQVRSFNRTRVSEPVLNRLSQHSQPPTRTPPSCAAAALAGGDVAEPTLLDDGSARWPDVGGAPAAACAGPLLDAGGGGGRNGLGGGGGLGAPEDPDGAAFSPSDALALPLGGSAGAAARGTPRRPTGQSESRGSARRPGAS